MTDPLNCTTDQYGNTACIGTAVHTHSTVGDLPFTGLGGWVWAVLAASIILLIFTGLIIRRANRQLDAIEADLDRIDRTKLWN